MPALKYQYAVRYRREGWESKQVRFYRSKPPALRLTKKLLAGNPNLAPLDYLTVERRELGPPETVWTLKGGRP